MDKNELIFKAFKKVGKFLREHPPADTCYSTEFIAMVAGGMNRDPEGEEWLCYFLNQVIEEEKLKE